MTHEEVKALVEEMGLPYAYDHFAEGESPDPPFICFLYPRAENFGADNLVYHHFNRLDIEVYTDYKDPDMEANIEEVLTAHELYYEKSEVWIEKMCIRDSLHAVVVPILFLFFVLFLKLLWERVVPPSGFLVFFFPDVGAVVNVQLVFFFKLCDAVFDCGFNFCNSLFHGFCPPFLVWFSLLSLCV